MDLSLNWLGDHVDLSGLDAETIAHELTMRTALVEGLADQRAALDGVVVGHVTACEPHPEADRLSVCRVEWGAAEDAHVVCGAPNVAAGQKVAYAPVKTRLPNGLKLKRARIRGQVSEGMICAEDELGLGPEHDGILVLDPGLEPGRPFGEVPGFADVVLDVDNKSVTHRPDLWGHRGFARELAAIFGRELLPLDVDGTLEVGAAGPEITLEEGAGCPLYAGLCIEDGPGRAPDVVRFRLMACGMRPIGLAVDLSNYVMLELGQPTHPFDRDRLAGDRIRVRRARPGEVLETLDGVERRLETEDLVIADGERAVAIAGVMGGASTEVGTETSRLFLESAHFDAVGVRRTSSRLGLRTEALARFEKDLDPSLVELAVRRYAALYRAARPEAVVEGTFRVAGAASAPRRTIALDPERTRRLLGVDVGADEMGEVLGRSGFGVAAAADGTLAVDVPSWRATGDVEAAEDLLEEVGRMIGYDRVPARPVKASLIVAERDPRLELEESLRDALAGPSGCVEVMSHSTLTDELLGNVGRADDPTRPRLANALQQDASRLRPSVLPGLLDRVEGWLRLAGEVRAFEVGRGYTLGDDGRVCESAEAAVVVAQSGARSEEALADLVRRLRGIAEDALVAAQRGTPAVARVEADAVVDGFDARRSACLLLEDVPVAQLGTLDPTWGRRLFGADALRMLVGAIRFDVDALAGRPRVVRRYAPVGRHPPARLDLAFVVGHDVRAEEIAATIHEAGPRTLREVVPFDVFRGGSLAAGERSLAYHLVFQAADRTLTDADVNRARERIVDAVQKLGARLR